MRKIFLLFVLLFVFKSSINAQYNPSNSIDIKGKNIIKTNVIDILVPSLSPSLSPLIRDLYDDSYSFKLSILSLGYERVINNKFSIYIDVMTETMDISFHFLNVDVAFRYYFSNGVPTGYFSTNAPIGYYLSASSHMSKTDSLYGFNLGILIGYQNTILGTDIYFDLALGIRSGINTGLDRPIQSTGVCSVGYLF
ncbi:hypothetical protein [Ichthyobacterium seriolicida]|uniref:Secreted protein n=1 Tax=Ichthyobacterium seriolicida TaxID=242600 RepID=A0A1J1E773_9FLAO|nr:hypothetical protein [Ichthyobacterium seriolicida]BAV95190.1 hypothetical protein JBKA6_1177 [Ichthyobacterium seriolicida]